MCTPSPWSLIARPGEIASSRWQTKNVQYESGLFYVPKKQVSIEVIWMESRAKIKKKATIGQRLDDLSI